MSKLNEDIIIRYLENRCSEEDFVLINEWMKESDENAGELFRMEEIYQLGKFPFEEENLVAKAERRLGRRLEQEKLKALETQKTEAENLEIVQMVRALRMTPAQLSAMLSGGTVPGSLADDNNEQEENSYEE